VDHEFDDILNPLSPEQSDVAVSSFGSFSLIKGEELVKLKNALTPRHDKQSNETVLGNDKEDIDGTFDDDLFAIPISAVGKSHASENGEE